MKPSKPNKILTETIDVAPVAREEGLTGERVGQRLAELFQLLNWFDAQGIRITLKSTPQGWRLSASVPEDMAAASAAAASKTV